MVKITVLDSLPERVELEYVTRRFNPFRVVKNAT
jgi:hypothetical protein